MPRFGRRVGEWQARKAWLGGASVFALSAAVFAAASISAPGPATAESLRDALASAYLTNPRLDAERARLRATDEDVSRAQSGFAPTVSGAADIGHQRTSSKPESSTMGSSDPWGYQITVRQSVFSGFRTTSEVGEAEAGVKAGRETLRQIESTVLLDGVTAYVDVVRDQAIVRLRDNNVEVLSRDLEAAETRRAVKEVTKTDVAQARARRARAVSAADLAKANLKVSRANFERIVGHAPQGLGMPSMKLKLLPRSIEEAWQIAERDNPNVNSALFREEAARYAVDKVRGELLPDVGVEASYGHRSNPNTAFEEQEAASVTGRVTVPLYDGGEVRARVRQAKHTHVSRIQEIEQARTETQANVTAAWSRLMAARAQLKSDIVQVDANRLALEGVREEERVGQRTMIEVLNAEQEYLDAQIQLVGTRHDVVVASYAVLATIGKLSAEDLALTAEVYDPEVHYEEARNNWFGIDIVHPDGRREVMQLSDPEDDASDIVE